MKERVAAEMTEQQAIKAWELLVRLYAEEKGLVATDIVVTKKPSPMISQGGTPC